MISEVWARFLPGSGAIALGIKSTKGKTEKFLETHAYATQLCKPTSLQRRCNSEAVAVALPMENGDT